MKDQQKKAYLPWTRPTSGLVKSIGFFGALIFGVHCISLSSSGLITFSWVSSNWPGASIVGLLLVSMGTSILHGYTFSAIGVAMPRSGADYILASRLINPVASFIASWTLVVVSGIVAGGLIAWIPKSAIPALLEPMAILFKNPSFHNWAQYCGTGSGSLLIGTGFVIVTFVSMLFPTRVIVKMMSIGFVLGIVAWIVIIACLGSSGSSDTFRHAWDHFVGGTSPEGNYNMRIALAHKAGMSSASGPATMTLAGLVMGFWIFYGYAIPTFFAGEIRRAEESKVLLTACWSSIIITGVIFLVAALLLQRLVPNEWVAAEGFLWNNQDAVTKVAGHPVPAYPWITFYAEILRPSFALSLFIAIAWIYTLINLGQTYFFYTSRIIFAWAFDRVVPDGLASLHLKWKSPVMALGFVAVLAEIGVIDASYQGPLGTQLMFVFIAVVTQLLSVAAIIIFPFRAPTQFQASVGFVKWKIGKVPCITIFGIATFIYLCWLIYASFAYPALGLSNPLSTLFWLLSIASLGAIVFYGMRGYRKKKENFDLLEVYRQVPPA